MGWLITVDFVQKRVISRETYWLGAERLHREALARFTAEGGVL